MSMSKVKKEFFEGIKVVYKDCRKSPEYSRLLEKNILKTSGKIWFKKHYPITIRAAKEFTWSFHDMQIRGIITAKPDICFLDGEQKRHFVCDFFAGDERKLTIFTASTGEIRVLSGDIRREYKAKTSEEFINFAKQIRKDFDI